jgi:hypothetical protein
MPKSSKTVYLTILIIATIAVSMAFVFTSSAPTGQWGGGISCNDSDDGLNYSVKGTCRDSYYPNGISDTCWAGTGGNLKELFCNTRNQCEARLYTCPNGCLNGICNSVSRPTTTGSLYADSNPSNATAHLNGVFKGITPLSIPRLTPGTYTLNLSKPGYYDNVTSVEVYAGQTTSVYLYLTPIPPTTGSIFAGSSPAFVTASLNGVIKGITPLTISDLAAGTYTLNLSQSGYYDNVTSVEVYAGRTTNVVLYLTPLPPTTGSISASSNPSKAIASLNGVIKGRTSIVIPYLTPGTYTLNLSQSGYYDNVTSVEVYAGRTTRVHLYLTRVK